LFGKRQSRKLSLREKTPLAGRLRVRTSSVSLWTGLSAMSTPKTKSCIVPLRMAIKSLPNYTGSLRMAPLVRVKRP
jgi:hypothetical protein